MNRGIRREDGYIEAMDSSQHGQATVVSGEVLPLSLIEQCEADFGAEVKIYCRWLASGQGCMRVGIRHLCTTFLAQ